MYFPLDKVVKLLKDGKVGVIPTDTIYGIVGSALNSKTVEEIYRLRKRAKDKPMIILISSLEDLKKFGINVNKKQNEFLQKHWPNPLSVVLKCNDKKFNYLHRSTNSLAFRMPKNEQLSNILKKTGPLVVPSANVEGEKPAENIDQAKKYFGNQVDFYLDGGTINSTSSTLVGFENDSVKILRQGKFRI